MKNKIISHKCQRSSSKSDSISKSENGNELSEIPTSNGDELVQNESNGTKGESNEKLVLDESNGDELIQDESNKDEPAEESERSKES